MNEQEEIQKWVTECWLERDTPEDVACLQAMFLGQIVVQLAGLHAVLEKKTLYTAVGNGDKS